MVAGAVQDRDVQHSPVHGRWEAFDEGRPKEMHCGHRRSQLAAGAPLTSVIGKIGLELLVGIAYAVAGLLLLWLLEFESRRRSTLDRG